MPVYIALLQGINVGPKKRIKMEELRLLISGLSGADVRTYVNSGNAIFQHESVDIASLESLIETALGAHIGVPVPTIIRTADELETIIQANPFPEAASEPKSLHVLFLRGMPAVDDVNVVNEMETGPDRLAVHGREVYLHLPNLMSGATIEIGKIGKLLRMDATARNWNSVTKLAGMARD